MSDSDEDKRRKKLAYLREHYIPIVDSSLEEQSQKGMQEASKKLKLLKRILLNDEELPALSFLDKSEAILMKLQAKSKIGPGASVSTEETEECQVLAVKKIETKRNNSIDCPRSPSPEKEAEPLEAPKLIPTEKRNSILDLPMPGDYDIDERPSSYSSQPSHYGPLPKPPPFPPLLHDSLPKPIAQLFKGVGNDSSLKVGEPSCYEDDDSDHRFSSDDVDMREAPPETYEPIHFEEVPSPPRLDIDLNSDEDDLIIDESGSSPTIPAEKVMQPPVQPLKPPKPPSALNIGKNDLESLAEMSSPIVKDTQLNEDPKGPADDFIPSRQGSRVPSSLMASKTGTITMPSPRPMQSPRPKPSSTRIPQSPAYDPKDLFTPDAVLPKYQFPLQRPVQVVPVFRQPDPKQRPPESQISLPDFVPPSSISFQPPRRPSTSFHGSVDPRSQSRDPRDPRRENRLNQQQQPGGNQWQGQHNAAFPQAQHRDPRMHANSAHVRDGRPMAVVRAGNPSYEEPVKVALSYREHRLLKEKEEKRRRAENEKMRQQAERTHAEKRNLEQEDKRRREAEERNQKNEEKSTQERLQRKTDIIKLKVQSRPTSKVQVIEPLPLPPSEMKKIQSRRGSEDRRSSTDSEGSFKEKHVDKSLEKISPLETLYGEMPQPAKTSTFRIPKKVQPRKSFSPPKRKSSITPPPVNSADFEEDAPSLCDSSDEDIGKEDEKGEASTVKTKTDQTENSKIKTDDSKSVEPDNAKDVGKESFDSKSISDIVKQTLVGMGFKADQLMSSNESKDTETSEPSSKFDIEALVKSIVQQELTKHTITPPKNEEEVTSSCALESDSEQNKPELSPIGKKAKKKVMLISSDTDEDDLKTQKPSTTEGSFEENIKQVIQQEVRKHKKSELDKLQEDIRESFIKDGVMSAVGPRTRHPVERYSLENKSRKQKKTLATSAEVVDKSEDDSEPEFNEIYRNKCVVRLERLIPPSRRVAKRGRSSGQESLASTSRHSTPVLGETSDTDQSERCPSSVASEDTLPSELIISDAALRGTSARGRGRGRGRKGRKGRSRPESYQPRSTFNDMNSLVYVWKKDQITPCKLCVYEGKKIVDHYINMHEASEILISRLSREEATHAILQPKRTVSQVLQCRFCQDTFTSILEFQDHVTEHTGEYRYLCPYCSYKRPKSNTVSQHIRSAHHVDTKPDTMCSYAEEDSHYLTGFLCGFCNFVQLRKEVVQDHITKRHLVDPSATCSPGLEEINEINFSKVDRHEDVVEESNPPIAICKQEEVPIPDNDREKVSEGIDNMNFMAMLDDLMQDKPQDPKLGKSLLESIRRSKNNDTENPEDISVKRIDIDQINLPASVSRPRELERSPSPPQEVVVVESPSPPEKEKDASRKRKNAIVGICYACGHTEGHDINNLFEHMRNSHPPDKRGNCPDCSRPLTGTDKAIRHMIEEHVPITSRQALLDYWKPQTLAKVRKTSEETSAQSNADAQIIKDLGIPLEEQPRAPQHARAVKNSSVYASMLEPGRLRKLYKCMGRNCAFSSDVPEKFIKHIDGHKTLSMGRIKDWQECVYCMIQHSSGKDLVDHIHEEHNKYVFQCSLCFYRSASESNVFMHQKLGHAENAANWKIYLCQKEQPKSEMPPYVGVIGNLIKAYICNTGECKKSFYRKESMVEHLNSDHPNTNKFSCHECSTICTSPLDLLKHYEGHYYLEYNCLLCKYGTEDQTKLHNHLCAKHANYTPCLVCRSLLGMKTEKNMLVGAVRRLEVKTHFFYQPPLDSEESDSDGDDGFDSLKSAEVMPSTSPPPTSQPTPIFSRTMSAIEKTVSLSATPVPTTSIIETSRSINPQRASTSVPLVSTPESPAQNSEAVLKVPSQPPPIPSIAADHPPPITRPLSTFSRSVEKEKALPAAPPPVTKPLSTFSKMTVEPTSKPVDDEEAVSNLFGSALYRCCNEGCTSSMDTESEFHDHLMICAYTNALQVLSCVHCKRTFKQVSSFVSHLTTIHGPSRFSCGVCQVYRNSNLLRVQKHLRLVHKITQTILRAKDALKNDQDKDEFDVLPKVVPVPAKSTAKSSTVKKFSPGQEKELPTIPIFSENVSCALCNFKTRVKSNMLRHLRDHTERGQEASSSAIPINPSPCLKAGEKHFDKMLNWAQSSHEGPSTMPPRRSSQELSDVEVQKMPVYIMENSRYECGVPDCFYKASDVLMLKLHLENLHDDAVEFKCVHCKDQEWLKELPDLSLIERSVYHMKQHGPNLYLCLMCHLIDASKKDMSKHFQEDHENLEERIQIIREIEPEEGSTWCCSECKATSATFEEIQEHCSVQHNIQEQYRCSACLYRSSSLPQILQNHMPKYHPGKPMQVLAAFYPIGYNDTRVKTGQPTIIVADTDQTRHIRMIRIEEVNQSEKKQSSPRQLTPKKQDERKSLNSKKTSFSAEELIAQFGALGSPDQQFLVCPRCKNYKNRQQYLLKEHLYRELEFKKYICNECGIPVVSKTSMQTHLQKVHFINDNFSSHILTNEGRPDIEEWVSLVLKHQKSLIPTEQVQPCDPLAVEPVEANILPASDPYDFIDSPMDVDEAGPSTSEPVKVYRNTPSNRKKSLNKAGNNICKHCSESFKSVMALKMHIKLYHFKAGKYVCGYCDVSANSENIIFKHSGFKHSGSIPRAIPNPDVDKVVFDDAFWEDNYGIYKTKEGNRMRTEHVADPNTAEILPSHQCQHCDFKTTYPAALKRHIVSHKFTYGCGICDDFESEHSVEVRKHSSIAHPGRDVDVKQILQERPSKIRKLDEVAKPSEAAAVQINAISSPVASSSTPEPISHQTTEATPLQVPVITPTPSTSSSTSAESFASCSAPGTSAFDGPSTSSTPPTVASPATSVTSEASVTAQKPKYHCKSCDFIGNRLKDVLSHWETKHKASGEKFGYVSSKAPAGKQCRHCNKIVYSEKEMQDHFKNFHPEHVKMTFKVFKCKLCLWRSDQEAEVKNHLSQRHQKSNADALTGYTAESKVVDSTTLWCLCLLCREFDSTTEEEMLVHCKAQHSESSPKFMILNNKAKKLTRELGREDMLVGSMSVQAVRPIIKSETPTASGNKARRSYVCPRCPDKTKTQKGMEEHIRQFHVVRMVCNDCGQVFVNDIAAKMHHLVEHRDSGVPPTPANIIKCEEDVVELMKLVKKENDCLQEKPINPFDCLTKREED